jgi:hypothetical protein
MKTDKIRESILISIIDMNLYSLKKFIYGSGYEQILSSGLKELLIEIDLLIKNHKDTKFNGRFDTSDWPRKHKTNLKRIKESYKELTK